MIVRYALRQIRRKPGFSLTVIVTLALSIGANLAVFQLLQAVLFAPLPVANPSQLYALHFGEVSLRCAVVLLLSGVSAPAAGIAARDTYHCPFRSRRAGCFRPGTASRKKPPCSSSRLISLAFWAYRLLRAGSLRRLTTRPGKASCRSSCATILPRTNSVRWTL